MVDLYARMEHPESGWPDDVEAVKRLDSTVYYPVLKIDIGGSSTRFCIDEKYSNIEYFNSVNFEFYELIGDDYVLYDIFLDPDLNPYLM